MTEERLEGLRMVAVPPPASLRQLQQRVRRRRAKRGLGFVAGFAVVLAAVAARNPTGSEQVRTLAPAAPTTVTTSDVERTVASTVAPSPEVGLSAAAEIVEEFIGHVSAGDLPSAAALWTGYPWTSDENTTAKVEAIEELRQENYWFGDTAGPGAVAHTSLISRSAAVVTVLADVAAGRTAAAFLVEVGPGGRIIRLPAPPMPISPDPGTPVRAGDVITFVASPIEGGVQAAVGGVDVPVRSEPTSSLGSWTFAVDVPQRSSQAGPVVLTLAIATPEYPTVAAFWYPLSRE